MNGLFPYTELLLAYINFLTPTALGLLVYFLFLSHCYQSIHLDYKTFGYSGFAAK